MKKRRPFKSLFSTLSFFCRMWKSINPSYECRIHLQFESWIELLSLFVLTLTLKDKLSMGWTWRIVFLSYFPSCRFRIDFVSRILMWRPHLDWWPPGGLDLSVFVPGDEWVQGGAHVLPVNLQFKGMKDIQYGTVLNSWLDRSTLNFGVGKAQK